MFEIEYPSRFELQDSNYILAFAETAPDYILLYIDVDDRRARILRTGDLQEIWNAQEHGEQDSQRRQISQGSQKLWNRQKLQGLQLDIPTYIGRVSNVPLWTGQIAESSLAERVSTAEITKLSSVDDLPQLSQRKAVFVKMRYALELLASLGEDFVEAATRARIINDWRRRTRFCGMCASTLVLDPKELAMYCEQCSEYSYPQIAPAVIIAIQRRSTANSEILLVRNKRSISGYYGLVSGYVEAGESLEQAAHREIFEETGLKVCNLHYVQSQSWPFPNSQMVGFTAEYESGEIRIQESELYDAKWFSAESLPPQPPKLSISSVLIDNFRNGIG